MYKSKWKYTLHAEVHIIPIERRATGKANYGKYNLTTRARRAVVGRNKQLDKGGGRKKWKCHHPLNCAALAVHVKLWLHFESTAHGCKHGLGIFGVHCINQLSSTWLRPWAWSLGVDYLSPLVSTSILWGSVGMICCVHLALASGLIAWCRLLKSAWLVHPYHGVPLVVWYAAQA